jgi:hypothetical protein
VLTEALNSLFQQFDSPRTAQIPQLRAIRKHERSIVRPLGANCAPSVWRARTYPYHSRRNECQSYVASSRTQKSLGQKVILHVSCAC